MLRASPALAPTSVARPVLRRTPVSRTASASLLTEADPADALVGAGLAALTVQTAASLFAARASLPAASLALPALHPSLPLAATVLVAGVAVLERHALAPLAPLLHAVAVVFALGALCVMQAPLVTGTLQLKSVAALAPPSVGAAVFAGLVGYLILDGRALFARLSAALPPVMFDLVAYGVLALCAARAGVSAATGQRLFVFNQPAVAATSSRAKATPPPPLVMPPVVVSVEQGTAAVVVTTSCGPGGAQETVALSTVVVEPLAVLLASAAPAAQSSP